MKVLDKAWKNCLKMWEWITNNLPEGFSEATEEIKDFIIDHLKKDWLKDNNYKRNIEQNCFLCEYNSKQKENEDCENCPAILACPEHPFHCTDEEHNYAYEPILFYKELMDRNARLKGDQNEST